MGDGIGGIGSRIDTARALLTEQRLRELSAARSNDRTQGASGATTATEIEQARDAATQFEGLLLQQLFEAMWRTVPQGSMITNSREEGLYRDMLNQALAKEMSETQSLGIRDVLMKELVQKHRSDGSGE